MTHNNIDKESMFSVWELEEIVATTDAMTSAGTSLGVWMKGCITQAPSLMRVSESGTLNGFYRELWDLATEGTAQFDKEKGNTVREHCLTDDDLQW